MKSVVLDAGALIAVERGEELVRLYLALAGRGELRLLTSSAVVAQVWRGGARQARLARLLASELAEEAALDSEASRRIGFLAAATGAEDVVDGHVALLARDEDAIVLTSDPEDLERWGVPKRRLVKT
jgi:predicted nucleic acid-binding protein